MTYEEMTKTINSQLAFPSSVIAGLFCSNYIHRLGEDGLAVWDKYGVANITAFKDVEVLYNLETEYIVYHRLHEKFGEHVVEVGDCLIKNNGAFFFEWERLNLLHEILIKGDNTIEFPHIPFFYSALEDRYDYKEGINQWIQEEDT